MVPLNTVSLPKHIDDQNIDLIAFSETRLDSNINDNQVQLNNYEFIRKDRNRNGGGVCDYLESYINYKVRTDLMPQGTESVVIEIT